MSRDASLRQHDKRSGNHNVIGFMIVVEPN